MPPLQEILESLRKRRGLTKAAVTRLMTRGDELMTAVENQPQIENLPQVKSLTQDFDVAYQQFVEVHDEYHQLLTIPEDIDSSEKYIAEAQFIFDPFRASLDLWIEDIQDRLNHEDAAQQQLEDKDKVDHVDQSIVNGLHEQQTADLEQSVFKSEAEIETLRRRDVLMNKDYELKREQIEREGKLERDKLAFQIQLKRQQQEQQMETQQLRQQLADLEGITCTPRNSVGIPTGVGLTHSTPLTTPRHSQGPQLAPPYVNPAQSAGSPSTTRRSWEPSATAPLDVSQVLYNMLDATQRQHQSLVESLQLPKSELSSFDGNPLHYWSFIRRFDYTMERDTISDGAKLNALLQFCTGKARELLRCCEVRPPEEGYRLARKLLKDRFGDANKISQAWIKKTCDRPYLAGNSELQEYADELRCCKETLEATGYLQELDNGQNLKTIVEKLPQRLRTRWLGKNQEIKRERLPRFEDVVQFVELAAREVSDPVFGSLADPDSNKKAADKKKADPRHQPKGSFAVQASQPPANPSSLANTSSASQGQERTSEDLCWCCNGQHVIFTCPGFKAMKVKERIALVRSKGLCMNCFNRGHMGRDCPRPFVCGIDGCSFKHSRFLHLRRQTEPAFLNNQPPNNSAVIPDSASMSAPNTKPLADTSRPQSVSCSFAGARDGKIALPIVPVRIRCPMSQRHVDAYALLDQGSTCTFCSDHLADTLGAARRNESLELTTLSGRQTIDTTSVHLQVSDLEDLYSIDLGNVYTRPAIGVSLTSVLSNKELRRWRHLDGIEIPDCDAREVHLIIGNNTPQALMPLEIRSGQPGEPYAVRTPFGWAFNGPIGDEVMPTATSYFVQTHVDLQHQVDRFWELEDFGRKGTPISVADQKVIREWDDTAQLIDGHYCFGIPFKHKPPDMPDNRAMAKHRLELLGKRLARDESLRDKYVTQIRELVSKGYAEPVPASSLDRMDGCVNYIPHHAVTHPRKPGKVRVVFDCSAKYKGVSLNERVHQGPDLTNTLVGVLQRFRQEPVAFIADVEAMFHQVKVTPTDRDALRFLWWDEDDVNQRPSPYRMTAHLFGGVWSPSASNYALRRSATDNAEDFDPETITTVLRNFYVDDCLKSTADDSTAIRLAQQLRTILQRGGFRLTKWISNSRELLKTIPSTEHVKGIAELDLDQSSLPSERALGVLWRIEEDVFGYDVTPPMKPVTRRGMLSTVSSVYDPLGFVSPFILRAKLIFQESCRLALGWDETVPDGLSEQWVQWLEDLPDIATFTVPRCLKRISAITSAQLHHFADASSKAYGAVSYLRVTNEEGAVHTELLVSKAKLAPIKATTIPRLELTAAVEAVKLDCMLRNELEITLMESIFWTDSTIVLWYLANEDKRFQTFVANRVARILDSTSSFQWRHVNTMNNPADDCSRGLSAQELCNSKRWLVGPNFLVEREDSWPVSPVMRDIRPDEAEVKKDAQVYLAEEESTSTVDQLLNRYSSWYRLRKAVAWILRFFDYLKKQTPATIEDRRLSPSDLRVAEAVIVRYVQRQCLSCDTLKSNRYERLKPTINEEGVWCVGGRLTRADLPQDTKHPWIIPANHHVTRLIVNHYHVMLGHAGCERVLAETRSRYWLVKGRSSVRSVVGRCIPCKRARARAMKQEMADLPLDRVTHGDPPFSMVGVDYFGPLIVKRHRTELKRYGCLFTCLTTRAIHLEVANSLDTDAFLNALHRYIARRGKPTVIRSDNGTNFVGAKAELAKAIKEWNQAQISETLMQKEIKWIFYPPGASHMGGVWERQIRTVRAILTSLLQQQRLDDDGLHTLFCNVESIVNGRPLTKLSDDPNDELPLTPNHLLLLRSGPVLPPCLTVKQDLYRRRWRQVQYMSDVFWSRWITEYLPLLQERQKWTKTEKSISVGDLVLVRHESTPRNHWPLGVVTKVYSGSDNKIRSVQLRFNGSLYDRPISKLCLLEAASD